MKVGTKIDHGQEAKGTGERNRDRQIMFFFGTPVKYARCPSAPDK